MEKKKKRKAAKPKEEKKSILNICASKRKKLNLNIELDSLIIKNPCPEQNFESRENNDGGFIEPFKGTEESYTKNVYPIGNNEAPLQSTQFSDIIMRGVFPLTPTVPQLENLSMYSPVEPYIPFSNIWG